MKRHGNLWPHVTAPETIELAYRRARQGKTWQRTVQRVDKDKDAVLAHVRELLVTKTFTTSEYRTKTISEPKERTIYILPFSPDRIVQHAVMAVVAPIWDAMFDHGSFACRPGRGQHAASRKVMQYVRRYPYVLQADVRKFYPSIDHDVAMEIVERKIKDPDVLWLLNDIIRSFPGGKNAPIGNLTSQWFGNLYLNELDRFIREAGVTAYARYNDDFLVFGDDKKILHRIQNAARTFLSDSLKLTMAKDRVYPTHTGVDFVGYRHFPKKILVRKSTARRMKQRLSRLRYEIATHQIERDRARSTVASILGWLQWANAYNFRRSLGIDALQEKIVA